MEELKVEPKNFKDNSQTTVASLTQCKLCKKNFNSKTRQPINIMCCGNLACLDCVQTLMNKSTERRMSIKGKFLCAFCKSDHCANPGYNLPLPF